MKNRLLKCLNSVVFVFLMVNVHSQKQSLEWTESYIRENVAITKISGRIVAQQRFVYEVQLTDFKKTLPMPPGFGLNGMVLADNGLGYDLVKGDGVYTSDEVFELTEERSRVIAKNYSVYDESFQFLQELREMPSTSDSEVSGPGIKCKIRKCGCPCSNGYTCKACQWWGWQCMLLYDCEISLGV